MVAKPRLSDLVFGLHGEDELVLLVYPDDPQPPIGDGDPRGVGLLHLAHKHDDQSTLIHYTKSKCLKSMTQNRVNPKLGADLFMIGPCNN